MGHPAVEIDSSLLNVRSRHTVLRRFFGVARHVVDVELEGGGHGAHHAELGHGLAAAPLVDAGHGRTQLKLKFGTIYKGRQHLDRGLSRGR